MIQLDVFHKRIFPDLQGLAFHGIASILQTAPQAHACPMLDVMA
ncbi:hypothetical protein N8703_00640 [Verrucomicrobia bacterium]|nr:hypothetical protein [Verrucomicrobiota bacterium]